MIYLAVTMRKDYQSRNYDDLDECIRMDAISVKNELRYKAFKYDVPSHSR